MSQFPRYLGCATQSWQFSVTTQQSSQQTPASLSTSSQDLASLNSEFIRWSTTLIHPFTFTVPSFFLVIPMLPFLASIFFIFTFHTRFSSVVLGNFLQCAFSSVYNDIIVLFAKPFNIRRAQNLANRCTWTPPTYYFSLHPTSHPCAALGGAQLHSAQHF